MTITYDPKTIWDADTEFRIKGDLLNEISKDYLDLEKEITELKEQALHKELDELRLRDKNPSLKDAWDQYQVVLTLSKGRHS